MMGLNIGVPVASLSAVMLLSGCADTDIPWHRDSQTQRWYTQVQLDEGRQLYTRHCAQCHGQRAQGAENWIKPDAQGRYPPPPLNGSAHAWHHPYPQLVETISQGTQGNMPAWGAMLNEAEIGATIAYFQSYWPDRGYQLWLQRHPH